MKPQSPGPGQESDSREGAQAVVVMLVGRMVLQATGLLTVLLLPHVMPTTEYGRLSTIVSMLALGGALVELGTGWLEMRFLAPAWRGGDTATALRIGSTTLFLRLALDVVVSLVLTLIIVFASNLDVGSRDALWLGLWIFCRFGITLVALFHTSLGNRATYVILENTRGLTYLLAVLLGYALNGLSGVFMLLGIIQLACFLVAITHLKRQFPFRLRLFRGGFLREHRHFVAWTAVAAIVSASFLWLPVVIVGNYHDLAQAAVLATAILILGMLHAFTSNMRQAILPIVATAIRAGDTAGSLAWMGIIARMVTVLSVIALLGWLLVGEWLVAVLWPADYAALYPALGMVLVTFALINIAACYDSMLNLLGHAARSALNLALSAAIVVAGAAVVVAGQMANAALLVCGAYALAAFVLALVSHLTLRALYQVTIVAAVVPLLLLCLGGFGVLLASGHDVSVLWKLALSLACILLMIVSGFLQWEDCRRLLAAMPRRVSARR
ncbi:MAG: hypothetical protein KDI14_10650 [Halioglobus sp.]|nr:hypothetical protein [Halioglobus sp.]